MLRGEPLYDIGTIIYLVGILAGASFTLTYGLTAPWWQSAIGRMFILIGSAIVFAGVNFAYQIIVAVASGFPLRPYTTADLIWRIVGYLLFTLATGTLLATYLHERRKPTGSSSLPIRKADMSNPPVVVKSDGTVARAWAALAPKLIAFLATGLTTSGVIALLALFGVTLKPELAVLIVGAVSTFAAWLLRDNILSLAPGQISLKVIAFLVTSVTVGGITAFASQLGLDLSPYSALIGVALTVAGTIVGYFKGDKSNLALAA